jgi:predicted TIM-barrel fold metal-dependent hydrolase
MDHSERLPIIDARCRVTIPEAGDFFAVRARERGRESAIKSFATGPIESFFEEINEAGVTTAVSVSGIAPGMKIGGRTMNPRTTPNDLMAKLQKEHWGRFIGVAGIDTGNGYHNALEEIDRCAALGLRIVFIQPGRSPGCDLDDRRLYPVYEKCMEKKLVMEPQTSVAWSGKSLECVHPRCVDTVAEDFPDLTILLGHSCYPYIREAMMVAARHPNVFLSPDMYLLHLGTEDWVKALNNNLFGLVDQFLFGTCFPSIPIKPFVDEFWKLPLKKEVLPKILYKNAMRIFRLENDPTFKKMYPA